MSRNRHRVTHFEGDDCDPPHPPIVIPTCACGHPRSTHRPTPAGRITYCTVWTSAIGQCACRTYTQDHQHEGWQLREDPEGRTYCAACGAQVHPTPTQGV